MAVIPATVAPLAQVQLTLPSFCFTPTTTLRRYNYFAKFLVVQEAQADSLLLDLALEGEQSDKQALTELLCARHPRRVRAAKKKWEQMNDESLVVRAARLELCCH